VLFTEINEITQRVKGIVFFFLDTVAPQILLLDCCLYLILHRKHGDRCTLEARVKSIQDVNNVRQVSKITEPCEIIYIVC
jgi:hypothetical protein